MCKWIYAAFTDGDGERRQGLYTARKLFAATFSPDTVFYFETLLTARSKDAARQLAADILKHDRETVDAGGPCLSYMEWAEIGATFERLARRFGLVREFRENGII